MGRGGGAGTGRDGTPGVASERVVGRVGDVAPCRAGRPSTATPGIKPKPERGSIGWRGWRDAGQDRGHLGERRAFSRRRGGSQALPRANRRLFVHDTAAFVT